MSEILECLKRIEDKLDELIGLMSDSEISDEETYYCPRCGKELDEITYTHLCEV